MTTQLAIRDFDQYAIKSAESGSVGEILRENLDGGAISAFDFDAVKVPSGQGATVWSIPSLDGETSAPSIEGVIVYKRLVRSYWQLGIEDSGGSSPPNCTSQDGIIGVGDPGGSCDHCPLAQFGSAENERGQACKTNLLLFMVRAESILPLLVKVPPSSLKPIRKYMMRLASAPAPFYGVITSLGLEKTRNAQGIVYMQIVPTMRARLNQEDADRMRSYGGELQYALGATAFSAETVD